jgi:pyrroloquinoline quinone biosynthesis protein D
MSYDQVRSAHVVLFPEGVLTLNATAADVLARCDGSTTVEYITIALTTRYTGVRGADVLAVLQRFARSRVIEVRGDDS